MPKNTKITQNCQLWREIGQQCPFWQKKIRHKKCQQRQKIRFLQKNPKTLNLWHPLLHLFLLFNIWSIISNLTTSDYRSSGKNKHISQWARMTIVGGEIEITGTEIDFLYLLVNESLFYVGLSTNHLNFFISFYISFRNRVRIFSWHVHTVVFNISFTWLIFKPRKNRDERMNIFGFPNFWSAIDHSMLESLLLD